MYGSLGVADPACAVRRPCDDRSMHVLPKPPRIKGLDWVYMAGGSLLFGFTAHVWYPGFGPVVDGLNLVPAIGGSLVGGVVVELFYRFVIRRWGLA